MGLEQEGLCVCVYEGWERRQEAGEGGPQTKPFLELQRFRALDFHAALAPPDPALAFHLRERGCCRMPPPTSGSCGIELEARFVRLRGPEPLLRRRLPPPRPALVEVVVSLPFFSSFLSPHFFPSRQECSPYSWGCG